MQSILSPKIMSYWFFCCAITLLADNIPLGHNVLHEEIRIPDADNEEMTANFFLIKIWTRKKISKPTFFSLPHITIWINKENGPTTNTAHRNANK